MSGPYRYCACVSSAWLALRATEVAHTNTEVPVLPEAILDKESPVGEWAPIFAGSAVSTNNASNALRTCHLKMALILDHVPQTPLLVGIQDWPRS